MTPDQMFEIASKLRAAGNAVATAADPSYASRSMATVDQQMFDARIRVAQGRPSLAVDGPSTCVLCDAELDEDEDEYCAECAD